MKLTVIIPVYNVVKYLDECLASLASQRMQDMEVWMIDDGSQDGSGAICDNYEKRDSRFHVIHQVNQGVSSARNKGLNYATGEYVFFVDGDDIINKDFFEQIDFEKYRGADIIFYGLSLMVGKKIKRDVIDDKPRKLSEGVWRELMLAIMNPDCRKFQREIPKWIYLYGPVAKLYRRDFLNMYNLRYNTEMVRPEDLLFNFQVYKRKPICYVDPIYCYIYRQNKESISHRYNPSIVSSSMLLLDVFKHEISNMDYEGVLMTQFQAAAMHRLTDCCKLDFCNENNPKAYAVRKKEFLKLRMSSVYMKAFEKIDYRYLGNKTKIGVLLWKHKMFWLYDQLWRLYVRYK